MGKVKAKLTCYMSTLPGSAAIIIKLTTDSNEINLVFRYDLTTVGIFDFDVIRYPIAEIEMLRQVDKETAFNEIAAAYEITKQIKTPIIQDQKLQKWIQKLGINKIDIDDNLIYCTYCDEIPIDQKQIDRKIERLRQKLDGGLDMYDIIDDDLSVCLRCKREVATEEMYDTEELLLHLNDVDYIDNGEIRIELFNKIPQFYSSNDPESQELLDIIISEKYHNRPAADIADRLLFEIFELRDTVTNYELEVILNKFDQILEILKDDPYDMDTGIPILMTSLLMQRVQHLEEYIDQILDILVHPEKIQNSSHHILLIASFYPEKVRSRMKQISKLGKDSEKFKQIQSEL